MRLRAAPVIMAGVRVAAVIAASAATSAAFIGASGLGEPSVTGLALADTHMLLSGALPAAALALIVDGLLELVERRVARRTCAGGGVRCGALQPASYQRPRFSS